MEEAWGSGSDHHIDDCYPWIQQLGDLREQTCLTAGTDKCKKSSKDIKLRLVALRQVHTGYDLAESACDRCMEAGIGPTANGVNRRILPCLESVVMVQIVCWLPEVEDFIAVLDWTVESCDDMAGKKDVEGYYSRQLERSLLWSAKVSRKALAIVIKETPTLASWPMHQMATDDLLRHS